jgi:hypothetical protein
MCSSSLLPDQQVLLPSQRARLSNFIHYQELQHGSPSVSSGKLPNLAGHQAHSNHPGPSSPTSSQQQGSSGPLYSQTPQPYSHRHDDSLPSAQDTVDSLFYWCHVLPASHSASDSWYELYETLELGTLPLPDQCAAAPPTQQPLAKIPKQKSVCQCKVVDDSENLCRKVFKKSGSCNTWLNHVIGSHPLLHDAVKEFQLYQSKVQAIELPPETDEPNVPSTPKRSRFEAAWDEFIVINMKQPLEYEEGTFIDLILKLITNQGVPFAVIQSDEF